MRQREQSVVPVPKLPLLLQAEPALLLGGTLLFMLLGNRFLTDDLLNSQSRADLIATVAPVLIVLKALSDLDITPREAEPVLLDGVDTEWIDPDVDAKTSKELSWAAESLMDTEACAAVAIWRSGRTILLRGTLPAAASAGAPGESIAPGPLLTKAMERRSAAPDYLPALQLLPGRIEFDYLPSATQGVLMCPLTSCKGALILACDRQRGFTPEDIAWARAVAGRLSELAF